MPGPGRRSRSEAPGGVRTEVLDPIEDGLHPAPLARALADPAVQVVVHAGRQDVAILRRTWRTDITNVLDTQVGAGFLGYGTQEGYESLVRRVLGERLPGGEGFTRWDRRPLSRSRSSTPRRREPAADARRRIERRTVRGRPAPWASEECRAVERSTTSATPSGCELPRAGRLTGAARGRAAAERWREERDGGGRRPPATTSSPTSRWSRWRGCARDRDELEQDARPAPADAPPPRARALAADRAERSASRRRRSQSRPARAADAPLVYLAQAVVRQRASEAGIATELVGTQSELAALVASVRRGRPTTTATCGRYTAGATSWSARS